MNTVISLLFLYVPVTHIVNFCLGFKFKPTEYDWTLRLLIDYPSIPRVSLFTASDQYRRLTQFGFNFNPTVKTITVADDDLLHQRDNYWINYIRRYVWNRILEQKADMVWLNDDFLVCVKEMIAIPSYRSGGLNLALPYAAIDFVNPYEFTVKNQNFYFNHRDQRYWEQIVRTSQKITNDWKSYWISTLVDFRGITYTLLFRGAYSPSEYIDLSYLRVTIDIEQWFCFGLSYWIPVDQFKELVNPLFVMGGFDGKHIRLEIVD